MSFKRYSHTWWKYFCFRYIWVWMHDDGSQTILSTDQVLDVSKLKQNGVFQFHCLASNVIENQRHNIIIKTSVDLTGFGFVLIICNRALYALLGSASAVIFLKSYKLKAECAGLVWITDLKIHSWLCS